MRTWGCLTAARSEAPHQLGAGGEHDVGPLGDGLFHQLVRVLAGDGVKVGGGLHLVRKDGLQLAAAELVLAGPGAGLRRALVDEGHLEVGGRRRTDARQDALDQRFLLFGGLRRLDAEGHGVVVLQRQHVVPQGVQLLAQLVRGTVGQFFPGIQPQQKQQHVAGGAAQPVPAVGREGLAHPVVQRKDIGPVVVVPGFLGAFAHQLLQARIAAGLGKAQRIGPDQRVIAHELIVHAHRGVLAVAGHHPGDVGHHAAGAEKLQHADPLVALLHIEFAHILKAAHRVADALVQMGDAEGGPFGGELGPHIQQRHEIGGKGGGTPRRLGADHQVQRHFDQAQRQLVFHLHVLEQVVQHRQVGRLPGGSFFAVVPLPHFQRFLIVLQYF